MQTWIVVACAAAVLAAACAPSPPQAPTEEPALAGPAPPVEDPSRLVWRSVSPDPSVFGGDAASMPFGSVARPDGAGVLAVGVDRSATPARASVWTTTDGFTWARVAPEDVAGAAAGVSTAMRDVAHTRTGYVAVGFEFEGSGADVPATTGTGAAPVGRTSAAVWTSGDGTEWVRAALGTEPTALAGALMTRLVATPAGLVALGEDAESGEGVVWTATDASTWVRVPPGSGLGAPEGRPRYLAAAETPAGLLVAGSVRTADARLAALWRSVDGGRTWTRVESPAFAQSEGQEIEALLPGPWGIVAAGAATEAGTDAAAVWTSPDSLTWSRVPHDEDVFGGAGGDTMSLLRHVGDGILGLGRSSPGRLDADAAVWTSSDGRNWRREPAPADVFGGEGTEEFVTAAEAGNRIVATGRSQHADRDRLRFVDRELLLWFAEARR